MIILDTSKEVKEEALNQILDKVREYNKESIGEKTVLDVEDITALTGVYVSPEEAVNKSLDEVYKSLIVSQGYDSFEKLYQDALENTEKRAPKNYAGLVKEERTVIRNGKPMKTTVYVDPNSGHDSKNNPLDRGNKPAPIGADMLSQQPYQPKNNRKRKEPLGIVPLKEFSDEKEQEPNFSLSFSDEEGNARGDIHFNVEGDYVTLVGYSNMEDVSGVKRRAYMQAVRTAWELGKGVSLPKTNDSDIESLVSMVGIPLEGNYYTLDREGIVEVLGEPIV